MTPAARLRAAIEVLDAFARGDGPADRLLAAWGRDHRFAGSKDRAAIADRVYLCLRQWRSLAWPLREDSARAAVIGSVLAEGVAPETLFTGQGHAPDALSAAESAALSAAPPPPPDPVRLDYPDWLDGPLRESLGAQFEPAMAALRQRAPVDLRVNALRATVDAARARLAEVGIATVAAPHAPFGLRAAPGAPVARTAVFADGWVEPQDAASQAAAALAAARPGETVLDLCAGGGGKTLALAAAMAGRGRIIAHDVNPARLRDLPPRAARAGVQVEIVPPEKLEALAGTCDLVFVDAPCSGSGSWRRDPGGKWRLTPERLADLVAIQRRLLTDGRRFLRPGGRLAFATCSVLQAEGPGHVGDGAVLARLQLTPADACDGFFCFLR